MGNATLYVWQVQAVEWLRQMDASALRGGICGYDMGLGKTVIACFYILTQNALKEQRIRDAPGGSLTAVNYESSGLTLFTRR